MGHTLKIYQFTGNSNLTRWPVFSFTKPVNPKPEGNGVYWSISKVQPLRVQNRKKCGEWIRRAIVDMQHRWTQKPDRKEWVGRRCRQLSIVHFLRMTQWFERIAGLSGGVHNWCNKVQKGQPLKSPIGEARALFLPICGTALMLLLQRKSPMFL